MRCESANIGPERTERSCGFLTKSEREYLLGEWNPSEEGDGYTDTQSNKKKADIQTRTRHALADFALLQEHADEGLKQGVVLVNADPPIFSQNVQNQIHQGLLRFASDASVGEDFSKELFDVTEAEDSGMWEAIKQLEGGDETLLLETTFQQLGELGSTLGISKSEAREIFEEAWG